MRDRPETFDVPQGSQACLSCGQPRPLNEDWFDRDAEKPSGFKATCKSCRKEQRKRKKGKDFESLARRQEMSAGKAIALLADGGSNCPHSAQALESIMSLLGGTQGMAKLFVTDYFAAAPGSQMRDRKLAALLKLISEVTASGAAKLPKHLMADEDIDREMERLGRKLKLHEGEVIDSHLVEPDAKKRVG